MEVEEGTGAKGERDRFQVDQLKKRWVKIKGADLRFTKLVLVPAQAAQLHVNTGQGLLMIEEDWEEGVGEEDLVRLVDQRDRNGERGQVWEDGTR